MVVAVVVAACTPSGVTAPPTIEPTAGVEAHVTWIVDGDTIEVESDEGESSVRLLAINAPDQGECFHDEALDHLVSSLRGREVILETHGQDQYDRTLAHVFQDDRHVNLEMVSNGFALASTPGEGDPHGTVLLEAEESAFESRIGLWGSNACGGDGPPPAVSIAPGESTTDPPGPDEEALDAEEIVIMSSESAAVDLSGWVLRDESSRHRHTFAEGLTIPAGGQVTVNSAGSGWSPGGGPVWNNDGDMALLQDAHGNIVSRWRYR